jgi:hypothetical protein
MMTESNLAKKVLEHLRQVPERHARQAAGGI